MSALPQRQARLLEAVEPPERRGIARDEVRLLVTDRTAHTHTHAKFRDFPSFLHAGDLLVVNDSGTLPAALHAQSVSGKTLMLHVATKIDRRVWMTEPRGAVLAGEELQLPAGGSAVMLAPVEREHPRLWYAWFQLPVPMTEYLHMHGEPIRYGYVTQRFPLSDYQTIFAKEPGSAEMPSAARPFTPRVVNALHGQGVQIAAITLHCGVASFEAPELPGTERFSVSRETAEIINRAKREGRRVIAVGSTALRALESAVQDDGIVASSGWTDVVMDSSYRVRTADALLTGFHDAAATHQWILQAFLERDLLASAYDEAAQRGYYQHEFGDIHLIL